MRICVYTDTALPKVGGQELVIDALCREFITAGHSLTLIAPNPRPPLKPDDAKLPYPVIRHPRFYSTQYFVEWYRFFLQRAVAKSGPFDVLHCHGLYPSGYVLSLCKAQLGLPVVLTSHGGDTYQGNVRLKKAGLRGRHEQAAQSPDRLIAISDFTKDGFLAYGADPAKIITIPNGVHDTPFLTPADRPANLDPAIQSHNFYLFTGRLVPRKGVDILLKAAALEGSTPIVVAGTGPESESLKKLATELNIASRLHFVGHSSGPLKTWLFQNAIATIVPSRDWEAFGLIVLESFAAGRPVIASNHKGLADLILASKAGLTFESGNADALAVALRAMKDLASQFTPLTRPFAAQYTWPKVAARHLELFQSLL